MQYSRITSILSSFAIALLGSLFITVHNTQAAEIPSSFINTAIAKEEILRQDQDKAPEVLTIEQRKEILTEIISASQLEIKNLTDALTALKLDEAWTIAQENFLTKLATSSEYYTALSEQLSEEDVSLEDIKTIAKDLKSWRENTYSSDLREIGNLILIFQTESVHNVVELRGIKIANDIKKLDKQKLVNTETLKKYLSQAEKSIRNAKTLTDKAKDLYFIASIEPLQPKKVTPEAASEETSLLQILEDQPIKADAAPTEETPVNTQDQVRDLAKESLKELKTAYELFFKMNDRIRK